MIQQFRLDGFQFCGLECTKFLFTPRQDFSEFFQLFKSKIEPVARVVQANLG